MSYRKRRDHKKINESLKESILKNASSFEGVNSKNKSLKDMMLKSWINYLKIEVYKKTSKTLKASRKNHKYYKRELKYLTEIKRSYVK